MTSRSRGVSRWYRSRSAPASRRRTGFVRTRLPPPSSRAPSSGSAVPGDENDRDLYAGLRQLTLEIQAAETGQADVEYEAGRPLDARVIEELLRRRERPNGESHGANQALGRPADRWVVIDDEDGRCLSHDAAAAGRRKEKVAPGP